MKILGNAQKIILIIAGILLFIILVLITWALIKAKQNAYWPPTSQSCPDYWLQNSSGLCMNTQKSGVCPGATVDFSGVDACSKYTWSTGSTVSGISTSCNTANSFVPWNGVSYGYGQYTPCQTGYNPTPAPTS